MVFDFLIPSESQEKKRTFCESVEENRPTQCRTNSNNSSIGTFPMLRMQRRLLLILNFIDGNEWVGSSENVRTLIRYNSAVVGSILLNQSAECSKSNIEHRMNGVPKRALSDVSRIPKFQETFVFLGIEFMCGYLFQSN